MDFNILNIFKSKKTETVFADTTDTTDTTEKNMMSNITGTFSVNSEFANLYQDNYQDLYKSGRGYLFGSDGFFPNTLNILYHASPLHSSILNFKKLLTVGNEYEVIGNSKDIKEIITTNQLLSQFDLMMDEIAMDYFIHSRIYLKITWNSDNTKILKIKRISPEKVRINELDEEMEPTSFLYSWDWCNQSKYKVTKYPKFDQSNTKDKIQLYQYQTTSPGQKLYSEPSYKSALGWVVLDAEMCEYHKANIIHSINPSMLIQYYEKPGTKEEKQQVLFDLNNSFAGARKTGRAMVTFSDSKELAPSVVQMEANKLDKTFLQLTDTIQRQIAYSHQLDPQLLGLKTPGSLGNSGDFIYSFNLFNQTIVQPAQRDLENIFNYFLAINKVSAKIKFNAPKLETLQPSILNLNSDEKNIDKITEEEMGQEGVNASAPSLPINQAIKSLTAKEHQQLLRIIRQYGKGQLTREAASTLLRTGLGLNNEDITEMLGE